MKSHFTKGHLPKQCYQSVNQIFYAETGFSKYDAEIIETLLIDKFKPFYNTDKVFLEKYERSNFIVPELSWKNLHILYKNNSVQVVFSDFKYSCFDTALSMKQRTQSVIEYNLSLIRHRPLFLEQALSNIFSVYGNNLLKDLLRFYLTIQIVPEESSTDIPLNKEEYAAAYAAFTINPNQYLTIFPILIQSGLVFQLDCGNFAVPLYTRTALQHINQQFGNLQTEKAN